MAKYIVANWNEMTAEQRVKARETMRGYDIPAGMRAIKITEDTLKSSLESALIADIYVKENSNGKI